MNKLRKHIVVLSGAGVSAESGLGTFRDTSGLWEQYAIQDVATPEAWLKDPNLVTQFYNFRRKQAYEAQPNKAHYVFADLEESFDVSIVTQNIDSLHERAGSSRVLHLHGDISKVKSSGPNAEKAYYDQNQWEVKMGDLCPEGHQLRPHVVWFGEEVPELNRAARVVESADIFVVVGTSLNVYPAAGLIHHANKAESCFLIDPNTVTTPSNFIHIKENATFGVVAFQKIMMELL